MRVEPGHVVLSTGEDLRSRVERLHHLAEQIVQERVPVIVRTWWTRGSNELVELSRAIAPSPPTAADTVDTTF